MYILDLHVRRFYWRQELPTIVVRPTRTVFSIYFIFNVQNEVQRNKKSDIVYWNIECVTFERSQVNLNKTFIWAQWPIRIPAIVFAVEPNPIYATYTSFFLFQFLIEIHKMISIIIIIIIMEVYCSRERRVLLLPLCVLFTYNWSHIFRRIEVKTLYITYFYCYCHCCFNNIEISKPNKLIDTITIVAIFMYTIIYTCYCMERPFIFFFFKYFEHTILRKHTNPHTQQIYIDKFCIFHFIRII